MSSGALDGDSWRSRFRAAGRALLTVYLVLCPVVFSGETSDAFEYPKATFLRLVALSLVTLGLSLGVEAAFRGATLREFVPWLRRLFGDPLGGGVLLFAVSALASTACSISPRSSWRGIHGSEFGCRTILGYAVLFFATRGCCRDLRHAGQLLSGAVCAAALATAYALFQFFGLDPLAWAGASTVDTYVRPFATLGHANHLAAYLVLALPVTAWYADRLFSEQRRGAALVLLAVAGGALFVILTSLSRGAWLAAAVVLGLTLVCWFARNAGARRLITCSAVFVVMAETVTLVGTMTTPGRQFLSSAAARLRHAGDAAGRQHIWPAALAIFREHPYWGCGPDCFSLALVRRPTVELWQAEWNSLPLRAHNEALHVLATQGLLGSFAGVLFVIGLVRSVLSAWRKCGPKEHGLFLALSAGVVGFAVQGQFNFTGVATGSLFVVLVGLLSVLGRRDWAAEPMRLGTEADAWLAPVLVVAQCCALAMFYHNFGDSELVRDARRGAVVAVLTVVSLSVTWALTRSAKPAGGMAGSPRGQRPQGRRQLMPATLRLAAHAALGAAALWIVGRAIVTPLRANVACRTGELILSREPGLGLDQFTRAVALDPACDFYWGRLALAARLGAQRAAAADRLGLLTRSREAFERAITLVPPNAYYHVGLGRALTELARQHRASWAEAMRAYDRALDLEGTNPYYFTDAANAALVLNEFDRARAYAERGVALFPNFGPLRAHLGYIALAKYRMEEAAAQLRHAVECAWYGDEDGRKFAAAKLSEALSRQDRRSAGR